MKKRILSPYEKNHLTRFGFDINQIDEYGEMPVEYITSTVIFNSHEFKVSPAVLIPRVETEELIHHVLNRAQTSSVANNSFVFADIGTGSGVIGLSVALGLQKRKLPFYAYLSDISTEALTVAQENYRQLLPRTPITFLESDLLTAYPSHQKFDVLIANLPYIPTSTVVQLDPSVRDFEPWLALDGGDLGLEIIHKLLAQAKSKLKPTGEVWLEIDESHTTELIDPHHEYEATLYRDVWGRNRFVRLILK